MKTDIQLLKPCYGTTYIRHVNGLYLSMKDGIIHLSNERFLWRIESFENDRFYLGEISGHDKFEYWWGKLQIALDSGYTEQHWKLYSKNNYIIIEHADSNLFLFFNNEEKLTVKNGQEDSEGYYFLFESPCLTNGYPYIEILSNTNKISLRIEPTILNIVDKNWLLDWANDLEKCVYSLSRLVGFIPFSRFEIRAYTNSNTWGYIYFGKPVVHINNKSFEKSIIRMRSLKHRDICQGTLHEISHLFDKPSWLFDAEAMANIKLGYVLKELDYRVSILSNNPTKLSSYETFAEDLYQEHGRLTKTKGLFCSSLTGKIIEISYQIGWEPFKKVFQNIHSLENESKVIRFNTFIKMLGDYSNTDVKAMFSKEEWECVIKELSK